LLYHVPEPCHEDAAIIRPSFGRNNDASSQQTTVVYFSHGGEEASEDAVRASADALFCNKKNLTVLLL